MISPVAILAAALTRTVEVCEACGEQDCDAHPDAPLVTVRLWRPYVALGVDRPPVLGTIDDLKRLGLAS